MRDAHQKSSKAFFESFPAPVTLSEDVAGKKVIVGVNAYIPEK